MDVLHGSWLDIITIQDFENALANRLVEEQQFFAKLWEEIKKADTFFQEKIAETQERFSMLIKHPRDTVRNYNYYIAAVPS
jgi:predicted transcriptional regulator YdeE